MSAPQFSKDDLANQIRAEVTKQVHGFVLKRDFDNIRTRVQNLEEGKTKKVQCDENPHLDSCKSCVSHTSPMSLPFKKFRRSKDTNAYVYTNDGSFVGCGEGLTPEGQKVVCGYMFDCVANDFACLRTEMVKGRDADARIYNALIVRVVLGIQQSLDAVANFCHQHERVDEEFEEHERIYFQSFAFEHTKRNNICKLREKLQQYRFNGKTFNDLANRLKHRVPWVGLASGSDNNMNDIYDSGGQGCVFQFLMNVYRVAGEIVDAL